MTVDVEEEHQGTVIEKLGTRKGDMKDMQMDGKGRVRIDFIIPSRGLIGFQTDFMTATSGSGLIYHSFDHYGPVKGGDIGQRARGVLISNATGKALTFALFNLQDVVVYLLPTLQKFMKVKLLVYMLALTTLQLTV